MTELSIAEQDFLANKTKLQIAKQDEANKRNDIANINRHQRDIKSELDKLNQRLTQADHAMANGDMTSDDYIALKRTIADKEYEIEVDGEVLAAQTAALQLLADHSRMLAERLSRQLDAVAGEVKQRALAASVAAGYQHLKTFALAVAAHHLSRHPFALQEKIAQAELAYRIIGEELCKAMFADESEAWLFMVEPSRAKSAIEEIISQSA